MNGSVNENKSNFKAIKFSLGEERKEKEKKVSKEKRINIMPFG